MKTIDESSVPSLGAWGEASEAEKQLLMSRDNIIKQQ